MIKVGLVNMGVWQVDTAVNMGAWQPSEDASREMTASVQLAEAFRVSNMTCGPKYTGKPVQGLALEGTVTSHE